jgi:hypothetical protein
MILHYSELEYQKKEFIKMDNELIEIINKDLAIELPVDIDTNELQEKLKQYINHLIQHNFEKLVTLLYRIDVSEIKLKQLLQQESNKDAGEIIAQLIIERQLQKIKTRNQFKPEGNTSEEEKW